MKKIIATGLIVIASLSACGSSSEEATVSHDLDRLQCATLFQGVQTLSAIAKRLECLAGDTSLEDAEQFGEAMGWYRSHDIMNLTWSNTSSEDKKLLCGLYAYSPSRVVNNVVDGNSDVSYQGVDSFYTYTCR